MKFRFNIFTILISAVFTLSSFTSFSKSNDEIILHKCDYIVSVANVINVNHTTSNSSFKITVIGKGSDIKNVVKELKLRYKNNRIKGKRVVIESFNRLKKDVKTDLLVISSQTKITPNDLKGVLKDNNYILLTDKYPYGISTLNNSTIKKLKNEINKSNSKLKDANTTIDKQFKNIKKNDSIITINKNKINENYKVISNQNNEISEQHLTIKSQKLQLLIAILSILLISSLLIMILRINKERKKALLEVKEKNKSILDSLNYSKNIQQAMLPGKNSFDIKFKDYFILFQPKDIVSGDFYWMEEIDGKVFLSVADCTGHGVPGAMLSMICSKALTKVVKELKIYSPAKILDQTVLELEEYFSKSDKTIYDGMDLSLVCLDYNNNILTYSGANNPLYYIENKKLKIIKADRQPIGLYNERKPYSQTELKISNINSIYLFSDGYADQFGGPNNKKFSKKRFRELLESLNSNTLNYQGYIIEKEINIWKGKKEQIDDITVIGVKF